MSPSPPHRSSAIVSRTGVVLIILSLLALPALWVWVVGAFLSTSFYLDPGVAFLFVSIGCALTAIGALLVTRSRTKRPNQRLWITLGVFECLLLMFSGINTYFLSPPNPATGTLDKYCHALEMNDYQTAFDQFIPNPYSYGPPEFDEMQFNNFYTFHSVASCTIASFGYPENWLFSGFGNVDYHVVDVLLTIVYNSRQQETDELVLVNDAPGYSNEWKIIDASCFSPSFEIKTINTIFQYC